VKLATQNSELRAAMSARRSGPPIESRRAVAAEYLMNCIRHAWLGLGQSDSAVAGERNVSCTHAAGKRARERTVATAVRRGRTKSNCPELDSAFFLTTGDEVCVVSTHRFDPSQLARG